MGVSSCVAKLSAASLGRAGGAAGGRGEAVTISVSVTGRVVVGVDEAVVGTEVVVGEGKGGRLVTVVVWGVEGAEEAPESAPPMAGTEDTGGSCRGSVAALEDTGDSSVRSPEKLVVVVDCGREEEARTDSTMDSAMEAVLRMAASWLGASEVAVSDLPGGLLLSVASPISVSSGGKALFELPSKRSYDHQEWKRLVANSTPQ